MSECGITGSQKRKAARPVALGSVKEEVLAEEAWSGVGLSRVVDLVSDNNNGLVVKYAGAAATEQNGQNTADRHYWNEQEINLLLELYVQNLQRFRERKHTGVAIWEEIAYEIRTRCTTYVTGDQCHSKIRNMKRTFLRNERRLKANGSVAENGCVSANGSTFAVIDGCTTWKGTGLGQPRITVPPEVAELFARSARQGEDMDSVCSFADGVSMVGVDSDSPSMVEHASSSPCSEPPSLDVSNLPVLTAAHPRRSLPSQQNTQRKRQFSVISRAAPPQGDDSEQPSPSTSSSADGGGASMSGIVECLRLQQHAAEQRWQAGEQARERRHREILTCLRSIASALHNLTSDVSPAVSAANGHVM